MNRGNDTNLDAWNSTYRATLHIIRQFFFDQKKVIVQVVVSKRTVALL